MQVNNILQHSPRSTTFAPLEVQNVIGKFRRFVFVKEFLQNYAAFLTNLLFFAPTLMKNFRAYFFNNRTKLPEFHEILEVSYHQNLLQSADILPMILLNCDTPEK